MKYFTLILLLFAMPGSCFGQLSEIKKIQSVLHLKKDPRALADSYNRMAILSHLRYRDSCLYYSSKALAISKKSRYSKGIADALNCHGIYYLTTNNYLSAKYFNDALALYKEIGDKENEAQLLMNMSVLMYADNNKEEAKKYVYEAYETSKLVTKDSIQSIILIDILAIDDGLSAADRDSIFQKGMAIAQKYKDYANVSLYLNSLGTHLYNKGKKQEGLDELQKSLEMAEREGCEYVKIAAYMTLGEMMLDLKRYTDGVSYYELGIKNSEKFGYMDRYIALAERLYYLYKGMGDNENALKYATLLLAKQKQYSEAVKKSGYNYLTYTSNELQLEEARQKNESQRHVIALFAFAIAGALLTAVVLWWALKNRKKYLHSASELYKTSQKRNRELENAEIFSNLLIGIIAHDIRQPFSNIKMITRLFNDGVLDDQQELAAIMGELSNTTNEAVAFMDGLLLWMKSTRNSNAFAWEPLHAVSLIAEANSFFRKSQNDRSIELAFSFPEDFRFTAPRQIALFIFRNLLNNATKYSPDSSTISIGVTRTEEGVCFSFRDAGSGISPARLESIFSFEEQNAKSMPSGSAGVALKISMDLIVHIGGKLWAESNAASGSIFFVCFPDAPKIADK